MPPPIPSGGIFFTQSHQPHEHHIPAHPRGHCRPVPVHVPTQEKRGKRPYRRNLFPHHAHHPSLRHGPNPTPANHRQRSGPILRRRSSRAALGGLQRRHRHPHLQPPCRLRVILLLGQLPRLCRRVRQPSPLPGRGVVPLRPSQAKRRAATLQQPDRHALRRTRRQRIRQRKPRHPRRRPLPATLRHQRQLGPPSRRNRKLPAMPHSQGVRNTIKGDFRITAIQILLSTSKRVLSLSNTRQHKPYHSDSS